MSDTTSTTTPTSGSSTLSSTSSTTTSSLSTSPTSRVTSSGSGGSSLRSQFGTTTIADNVVSKIAALAAREVNGVAELGGSVGGAISGVLNRVTGTGNEPRTAGVSVEVGETQAAVDLTMKVLYPASIHEVADAVRQNVRDRVSSMTALEVVEVNVAVVDLVFPGEETGDEAQRQSRVE